ncbi:hypothetical protein KIH31_10350 [Paenarthrobacter sp. DKR-5]|uniref:LysM peptidoglycan-binding domain-containing protein n=1 Tax=Paenarthrobacter sp. DKR-5 TaxID=2835535 RepID=UPI001BDD3D4F|nr:LysM domain-containing protein [Paenarthrobacter sp. DKR-5]MBT1003008.1 hypothetical protein [Paenarthrobacter sp. DKR-5]
MMEHRAERGLRADAAMGACVLLLGIGLAALGTVLQAQRARAAARHEGAGLDDLLASAASLAGTAVTAWWLIGLVLALFSAALQRAGHHRLAGATARLSPSFLRRLAVAAFGVQLIAAAAASAADRPPEPAWSVSPPARAGAASPSPAAAPVAGPQAAAGAAHAPPWRPLRPVIPPGLLAPAPRPAPATGAPAGSVVVRDGDCLWSIAARQLGPDATDVDIARAWPRWHAANLAVIGEDPSHILPGQVLVPPRP